MEKSPKTPDPIEVSIEELLGMDKDIRLLVYREDKIGRLVITHSAERDIDSALQEVSRELRIPKDELTSLNFTGKPSE